MRRIIVEPPNSKLPFFLAFLYCGRIFMEICDFSYHHGAYFHHEDGSELFCFQQSVFSGVFFVDGIYIVCCRIHCMENAGQSYIRGFPAICHIAVMMIVIYCQSENQRIAACVSLGNCLILQKLSCCIFCIFDAETWVWADPVYGSFPSQGWSGCFRAYRSGVLLFGCAL